MLDSDLAELYGVVTKRLNEQVGRNIDRIPEDFIFELTQNEYDSLRSQIVIKDKRLAQQIPSTCFCRCSVNDNLTSLLPAGWLLNFSYPSKPINL
ncbi:ORF6N domain-containing protein [Pedobacter alpinus]|uniref:ORF6N domain-containing protein n=1 Tax=Pedobacter alpinus TaxID=1590643 RepID=A0ABW5TRC7_9SPHI